mmetsp:Transcript_48974/g.36056  ORF Transcript_48974/g.36056 Transcript_48974/m.36056 type:complete len:121 (+) Transcript_48974:562-924(+)
MSVELNGSNEQLYTTTGTHVNQYFQETLNTSAELHVRWMPNDKGRRCCVCNKKFRPVIRRRHHCRCCGLLVCGTCSPEKDYVQGYQDAKVRVCQLCFAAKMKREKEMRKNNKFNLLKNFH